MHTFSPAAFRADGRWDVPSEGVLERLVAEGAPFASSAPPSPRQLIHETYLDTDDAVLESSGITCALRAIHGESYQLVVERSVERAGEVLVECVTSDALTPTRDRLVRGESRAVEALRLHVDPSRLRPRLQLDVARRTRVARSRHWWRRATFGFAYDTVTLRAAGLEGRFHEVALQEIARGRPSAQRVADALREQYALRSISGDRRQRAQQLFTQLERDAGALGIETGGSIALLALVGDRVAAVRDGEGWRLPSLAGSGEEAARLLMRQTLGTSVGDLHLVTQVEGAGDGRAVELWCCTRVDQSADGAGIAAIAWIPIHEMVDCIARREGIDRAILSTLASFTAQRSTPHQSRNGAARAIRSRDGDDRPEAIPLLDPEISVIRFNERVMQLAEEEHTPLAERLRFLAIVSANLDEFVAVRVGRLKYRLRGGSAGASDSAPARRLSRIAPHVDALVARLGKGSATVLAALAQRGADVVPAGALTQGEAAFVREHFRRSILPALTPRHLGVVDGHTLPLIPDRTLALAVVLRNRRGQLRRVLQVAIPQVLPRFIALPGGVRHVAIEDVVRGNIGLVFPDCHVERASLFRLVRLADLALDDRADVDGVQVVDEHSRRRERLPVVRIEVEQGTSAPLRQLLLKELSFEPGARPGVLRAGDVCEVPGMLDPSSLAQLANAVSDALSFAPLHPRDVTCTLPSLWDAIRERDLFLHHPFDDFDTSVVRYVRDAAEDPDVLVMKMTLYRTGEQSPIADALCRAAARGKDVTAFVELKARFDESRNVEWARRLQRAGVHVIHGIPGCKNHAKCALVVRREGTVLRRYAHVGTGNYNASTARRYTDFGLLTARAEIVDDIASLFTTFTAGGSVAMRSAEHCLIAPHALSHAVLMRIRREARHARAGRPARIRMKLNGLADREVIEALYDASCAGVQVELVVRGICTLVPGVPGLSERIRVVSIVGRFLEHARCLAFDNDGKPEWWIGSADMRPRNLHRRIELLVPVTDASHRARLDALFAGDMCDPTAWRLTSDGTYEPPRVPTFGDALSAQRRLVAAACTRSEEAR